MKCLKNVVCTSLLLLAHGLTSSPAFAADAAAPTPNNKEITGKPALVEWATDYGHAMRQAIEERKMLAIFFTDGRAQGVSKQWEDKTLPDANVQKQLSKYVRLKLPTTTEITVDGKSVNLLRHPAFAEMLGQPGLAILDLSDKQSPQFHQVVSVLPFLSNKYVSHISPRATSVVLTLPPGTLTQRTMIFAVRMHPEAPASAEGAIDPTLASEANSHSSHQANIHLQGHHNWENRFHRINAKLPSGLMAQEVVAESWPNESLLEACEDCVHSWRQSPGHWGAVRERHPLFAFDIKRGGNGVWYATGIFGKR